MENNSKKTNLGIVILIFIIIVLTIALVVVYYLGFVKNVEKFSTNTTELMMSKNEVKEEKDDIEENEITSVIPTSDLVTLFCEATNTGITMSFAYIEDGFLYYFSDSQHVNGVSGGDFISFFRTISNENDKIKKYEGLKDIKRIKTYNIGTDVNSVPFLITEDGEVYVIEVDYTNNDIKVELYEHFSGYKVEDIINHEQENSDVFEIMLKDGSVKKIDIGNYM